MEINQLFRWWLPTPKMSPYGTVHYCSFVNEILAAENRTNGSKPKRSSSIPKIRNNFEFRQLYRLCVRRIPSNLLNEYSVCRVPQRRENEEAKNTFARPLNVTCWFFPLSIAIIWQEKRSSCWFKDNLLFFAAEGEPSSPQQTKQNHLIAFLSTRTGNSGSSATYFGTHILHMTSHIRFKGNMIFGRPAFLCNILWIIFHIELFGIRLPTGRTIEFEIVIRSHRIRNRGNNWKE